MDLKISSNFQFCWNKFANFLSKYLLKTKYLACFSTVFLFNWKTNVIGKWPIMSTWIILLMNWISWTVFVMLWSMVVAVHLFTLVGLFIVGIILQKQIIHSTDNSTVLLFSTSKRLKSKSATSVSFYQFFIFRKEIIKTLFLSFKASI